MDLNLKSIEIKYCPLCNEKLNHLGGKVYSCNSRLMTASELVKIFGLIPDHYYECGAYTKLVIEDYKIFLFTNRSLIRKYENGIHVSETEINYLLPIRSIISVNKIKNIISMS